MATIYTHTTTVNPGEAFVLPPGSKIIFTTDNDGLESVCADLDTEALECYVAMHFACGGLGDGEPPFEEGNNRIVGFYVGETFYQFDIAYTPYGWGFTPSVITDMLSEMQSKFPAIADFNYRYNGGGSCPVTTFQIKTIPSVGDNISLYITTEGSNMTNQIAYRLKFFSANETVIPNTSIPFPLDDNNRPDPLCEEA